MTGRPSFWMTAAATLLAATSAFADYEQDIVRQLQGMGFSRIEVTRTLLGRVRITAIGSDGSREIILNPNTGEILRDLWSQTDSGNARALLEDRARSGGSDDGDDDRPDSDSGKGSSGSGSSGKSGSNSSDGSGSNSGSNSNSNSGSNSGSRSGGGSDGKSDGDSDKGSDDDDSGSDDD